MEMDLPQNPVRHRSTTAKEKETAERAAKQPGFGFVDQANRPSNRREPLTNDITEVILPER